MCPRKLKLVIKMRHMTWRRSESRDVLMCAPPTGRLRNDATNPTLQHVSPIHDLVF